jgi:RHS repeat-associated protein
VTRLRHLAPANKLLAGTTYGYDRQWVPSFEGKLHQANGGESYAQDSLSRLVGFQRGTLNTAGTVTSPAPTGLSAQTWRLDGAGNWVETRRTTGAGAPVPEARLHSPRNAVTGVGATVLSYDANGALLSDGSRSFAWDYAGRLRRASLPGGQTVTFAYDGPGRRIARTVTGGPAAATGTTRFTFDGWREIEERNGGGTLLAQTDYGAWLDEPVARDRDQTGDGQVAGPMDLRLFYHQNAQFSVYGASNRQGKLVEGYGYDPYGRPTVYTPGANGVVNFGGDDGVTVGGASAVGNPFGYTGRPYDPATRLYDLRNRQLDPVLGRFISADKLGAWGDPANLGSAYAYVAGRPHWGLDPMGLGGFTKGLSNIKQQSAGDPIPGVDVNLEQNPGGNMAAMAAGKGIRAFSKFILANKGGGTDARVFSKFALANRGGANPLSVAQPGMPGVCPAPGGGPLYFGISIDEEGVSSK